MNARSSLRALLLLSLCLMALPARGGGKEDEAQVQRARIHLQAGILHFQAGEIAAAEAEMRAAFRLRPTPEMQYNLGQCYESMGELAKAVDAYRGYLIGRPQAPDRAEVDRRIAALTARAEEQQQKTRSANQAPEPPPPPLVEKPKEQVVFKTLVVYRAPPPKAGRSARFAALSLLGVTVAGLATGLTFTVVNANLKSDLEAAEQEFKTKETDRVKRDMMMAGDLALIENFNAATVCPIQPMNFLGPFCAAYNVSATALQANEAAAIVSYSVAAAAGLGALGFFLYGQHQDRRQARELAAKEKAGATSLSLSPLTVLGGGGLALQGSF